MARNCVDDALEKKIKKPPQILFEENMAHLPVSTV